MIRHAAALAVAACLSQALVHAQSPTFTVGASPADVHKGPSTGSPVVGTAPRGSALDVTRELGSWVSVSWPGVPDGEAFVHISRGSIRRSSAPGVSRAADVGPPRPAPDSSAVASAVRRVEQMALRQSQAPVRVYATPSHVFGLGGLVGGSTRSGIGATARLWRNRLAAQLTVSRDARASTLVPGRLTSVGIEPGILYSPRDHVTEYLWVRPYAGSAFTIHRQTLRSDVLGAPVSASGSGVGIQAFGGGELTFANLPRFAISADVGYRWAGTPIPGFQIGGRTFSLSGHWYVK